MAMFSVPKYLDRVKKITSVVVNSVETQGFTVHVIYVWFVLLG